MKALILYENMRYDARATATLHGAARQAGIEAGWTLHYWRCDLLRGTTAADEAQVDAADANLILIAGSHAHTPPVWLMVWLENWATNRQVVDAALAIVGDDMERGPAAFHHPQLGEFARRQGLGFIIFDKGKNHVVPEFFARGFHGNPPLLHPVGRDPKKTPLQAIRPDWGINE